MIAPEKLLEAAKALEPQLQEWRRTLHRHPEVGFDLPKTGDNGTKMLTIAGTLLILCAGGCVALLIVSKRKKDTHQ